MKRSNKAFTLIELLIVVAIIAILAAIAVPNFLEAQVRAKTARVKSDQRTIATALESYYVDNNHYPPQGDKTSATYPYLQDPTRVWGGESSRHAANLRTIAFPLSTPIAYLSSTQSVFADPYFTGYQKSGTSVVNDTRYYNYSGDYYGGRIFDSAQDGPDFETTSKALQQKAGWHLRSRGPDGDYESRLTGGWADLILYRGTPGVGSTDGGLKAAYDPTNGTVSNGDIARFGKGLNPSLK
ncbi:hypothetical protein BH09SUM1_BH09SUM1_06960 [soil metagenome]